MDTSILPIAPEPEGEAVPDTEIRRLIEGYPLAWVCSGANQASQLPLVGLFDQSDRLLELVGHLALRNPLREALEKTSHAMVMFSGPEGYISPSMVGRRNWGPTWNFAQVKLQVTVDVSTAYTDDTLEVLANHVENGLVQPWRPAELGERYDSLAAHIVGFRARPTHLIPRFKLGQDESLDDLRKILANMPDSELKNWMKRANQNRL